MCRPVINRLVGSGLNSRSQWALRFCYTSMTSVRLSVCLSVTLVDCVQQTVEIAANGKVGRCLCYLHAEADPDYDPVIQNSTEEN